MVLHEKVLKLIVHSLDAVYLVERQSKASVRAFLSIYGKPHQYGE
jgi:hypothetical protein